MTPLEACRLMQDLESHTHWVENGALAAAITQQLEAEDSGADSSGMLVRVQMSDGMSPEDAPLRRRYAEAVRVALRAVYRNDERLGYLPELRWQEPERLVAGNPGVSVADLFNAVAEALDGQETPLARLDALMQQRFPEVDRQAIIQAIAYVMRCLSEQAGGDEEDNTLDPREVACDYAKESLAEWVWSITDEFSPFGNDCGWDWLQRIAQSRHAPDTIESEVLAELAYEWEFSGGLPTVGQPGMREIDIAQALLGAAFASLVLWGRVTANLRDEAVRAAHLLGRTGGAEDRDVALRFKQMAEALEAAPTGEK